MTTETPMDDDFSAIAARAAEVEGGPPVPGTPQADATEAAHFAEQLQGNAELFEFAFNLVLPMIPDRFAERYGTKERDAIVRSYTAVAVKRGWDVAELLGKWGPELALAAAIVGPVLPLVLADIKAKRAPRVVQPIQGGGDGGASQSAD